MNQGICLTVNVPKNWIHRVMGYETFHWDSLITSDNHCITTHDIFSLNFTGNFCNNLIILEFWNANIS